MATETTPSLDRTADPSIPPLQNGDRLTRAQVAGLAVGFVGVAVTAGLALSDLAGSSLGGVPVEEVYIYPPLPPRV